VERGAPLVGGAIRRLEVVVGVASSDRSGAQPTSRSAAVPVATRARRAAARGEAGVEERGAWGMRDRSGPYSVSRSQYRRPLPDRGTPDVASWLSLR
jgi:hypothetical protein